MTPPVRVTLACSSCCNKKQLVVRLIAPFINLPSAIYAAWMRYLVPDELDDLTIPYPV